MVGGSMVLTSKRFDDTYRWRGDQVSRCEETVPPNFTSKDVARLAGVSQSTVSYVLSGKRPISEATRRKVLEAIEGLTYEPNAGARALASQRTSVIGLVVPFHPGSDAAGMLPFIETIASSARARDHEVLLVTADEGSAGLRRLARRSLCDAIVMMDIEAHDERIPVAASLRVPVVLVGVPEQPAGLRCVDLDFREAGRLAVDELAETGHDRVICLGYPAEVIGAGPQLRAPVHELRAGARGPPPAALRGRRAGRARSRRARAWPSTRCSGRAAAGGSA